MTLREITGTLRQHGQMSTSGSANEEMMGYKHMVFEDEREQETYIDNVSVPGYIDPSIQPGVRGTFFLVTVNVPTIFGSKQATFLYALKVDGKIRQGVDACVKSLRELKMMAPLLCIVGIVGLLLFIIPGLVIFAWAFRLVTMSLPTSQMKASLPA